MLHFIKLNQSGACRVNGKALDSVEEGRDRRVEGK